MCATHCGIDLHVRDNMAIKVTPMEEHKLKRLCIKARGLPELHQSRDRLLYPQKKTKQGWQRISWDEAMGIITAKLHMTRRDYGPEALFILFGHAIFNKESIGLLRRFAQAYGTGNIVNAGCLCEHRKLAAGFVTCGEETWHDTPRAKCVLHWGMNIWGAQTPAIALYKGMKDKGQKLIVVDPRVTKEAKLADLYLQPRPGTDLILMLAMLNIIISEELYDREYVEKYTVGFDQLATAVKEYSPQKATEVSGVSADKIVACARMYATHKPAAFGTFVALEHSTNAFQNFRASQALMAITGNIGVTGGNRLIPRPPSLLGWTYHEDGYEPVSKTFSADRLPLWDKIIKDANGNFLPEAILTGKPYPVRGGIIQAGNPAVTFLDSTRFREAMESLDFLVVQDLFMTETAELADIVLPATTGLESRWSHAYIWAGLALIAMSKKVFEPAGECWSDSGFWLELGKRMGFNSAFPWKDTDEIIEKEILAPFGKTIKDLQDNPGGFFYAPKTDRIHETEGFNTPSGKIELYSSILDDLGLPPLPVPYIEPLESPVSTPDVFKKYPFIAISGARQDTYEHSCWRNIPTLRRHRPDPRIEINTEDSKKIGIEDGEWAIIESPKGRITMKAEVTDDIMEGVVSMPHGWSGEYNVNILTSVDSLDPFTAAPILKGFACRVLKKP